MEKPALQPVVYTRLHQEFSPRVITSENQVSTGKPPETVESFLKGKKVLVVEDNLMSLYIAKTHLAGWGMEVTMVENGLQAVETCQKKGFDVILMDTQMPVMTGFDAAKIIKTMISEISEKKVPIIGLIPNALEEDKKKCLEAGMSHHLSKPYHPQNLKKVLMEALNHDSLHLQEEQLTSYYDPHVKIDLINIYASISLPIAHELHECSEKFDIAGFRALLNKFSNLVKTMGLLPFYKAIESFLNDSTKARSKQDLKDLAVRIEDYVAKSQSELKDYLDQSKL
jgi:CheY-like chemotaxis protein